MNAGIRRIGVQCRVLAVAGVMCALSLFTACHRTPDEQQIRQAIESAASAARGNDAKGVLAVVSDDFTGNDGDFDKRELGQMLALRALRQDRTGVLIGPISFEHKSLPRTRSGGDRIVATFRLTLTGGKAGELLPDQVKVYDMTTAWRREGGEWRCYDASWSR